METKDAVKCIDWTAEMSLTRFRRGSFDLSILNQSILHSFCSSNCIALYDQCSLGRPQLVTHANDQSGHRADSNLQAQSLVHSVLQKFFSTLSSLPNPPPHRFL